MSGDTEPRFSFDADGVLSVDFGWTNNYWREPICPECGEPIRWVLDMASWTSPPSRLAHARCLWLPEGFHREAERAITEPPPPPGAVTEGGAGRG